MKVFDQAVWRLTGIYTAILLVVIVGFSAAFYFITDAQLNRPFQPRGEILRETIQIENSEMKIIFEQRDNEMRNNLLMQLIIIDTTILLSGAVLSYFLAKHTLRPVQETAERESRFVSDASHELRTPLTAMSMENEVILRDKKADKAALSNQIKSNLEEIKKIQGLTDRLLKLSRNEKLELSETDIKDVVKDVLGKLNIPDGYKIQNKVKSRKITTNADALGQILVILLDNAIKYSPNNSAVTIGDNDGKIFVRDNGVGVNEDDLPHIFERFYRAEKSRTSDGYGLGLPLAQRLAGQINMKITVKSNKTKGTTFYTG